MDRTENLIGRYDHELKKIETEGKERKKRKIHDTYTCVCFYFSFPVVFFFHINRQEKEIKKRKLHDMYTGVFLFLFSFFVLFVCVLVKARFPPLSWGRSAGSFPEQRLIIKPSVSLLFFLCDFVLALIKWL